MEIHSIGWIECDISGKFGLPRQSGLVEDLTARVVFAPAFRNSDALRGLDGFSHIWLLWYFSLAAKPEGSWSPTVRPPRLGGNRRMGVFATRSPFRPNPIGLSCVRLLGMHTDPVRGPILTVAGADLADGTPILDIKPYLPYTDCRPDATGGFAQQAPAPLPVHFAAAPPSAFPREKLAALEGVLAQDPRPRYQSDPNRIYAMDFAGFTVRFTVSPEGITVTEISPGVPDPTPPEGTA